jgi:hypothetical protein
LTLILRAPLPVASCTALPCLAWPRPYHQNAAKKEVVIVDLSDANNTTRRPISAESAIMHPTEKIIALRGEPTMFCAPFHLVPGLTR